jgi:hypothetical protein
MSQTFPFSAMRGEREAVARGWLSCLGNDSLQETGIPGWVSPLFGSDKRFLCQASYPVGKNANICNIASSFMLKVS